MLKLPWRMVKEGEVRVWAWTVLGNPKYEVRNTKQTKQIRNKKLEIRNSFDFFEFRICFEFRVSSFEFIFTILLV